MFIAQLLFFWLILVHSIAVMDNLITIDEGMFFLPKIALSVLILVYLLWMRVYVYIMYAQDPFFDIVIDSHLH